MSSFVLHNNFLNNSRVFALVENSAQEHIHGNQESLNPEQLIMEKALASCFTSVLQQCSTPIFMVYSHLDFILCNSDFSTYLPSTKAIHILMVQLFLLERPDQIYYCIHAIYFQFY